MLLICDFLSVSAVEDAQDQGVEERPGNCDTSFGMCKQLEEADLQRILLFGRCLCVVRENACPVNG